MARAGRPDLGVRASHSAVCSSGGCQDTEQPTMVPQSSPELVEATHLEFASFWLISLPTASRPTWRPDRELLLYTT